MSDTESIIRVLKMLLRQRYRIDAGLGSRLAAPGIDSLHILDLLPDVEAEPGIELGGLALPPHATLGQLAGAIADVWPVCLIDGACRDVASSAHSAHLPSIVQRNLAPAQARTCDASRSLAMARGAFERRVLISVTDRGHGRGSMSKRHIASLVC